MNLTTRLSDLIEEIVGFLYLLRPLIIQSMHCTNKKSDLHFCPLPTLEAWKQDFCRLCQVVVLAQGFYKIASCPYYFETCFARHGKAV